MSYIKAKCSKVLPILDYGCPIYGSAYDAEFLDPVHIRKYSFVWVHSTRPQLHHSWQSVKNCLYHIDLISSQCIEHSAYSLGIHLLLTPTVYMTFSQLFATLPMTASHLFPSHNLKSSFFPSIDLPPSWLIQRPNVCTYMSNTDLF